MANRYISDLHFFHKNVTAMGSNFDNRPFQDIEEMHAGIRKRWNQEVAPEDDVYVLGDLIWNLRNSNREAAKELLDSLAMSGIANEIAGSSAPTSGSEHLISHALDKILEVPQLHGIQVGIATYIMAKVQDHRYIRVGTVLKDTGFWDYVETLHMKKSDFLKAIDMAPSIKPHRHTYLHEEKYREAAKKLVLEDEVLSRVLED